MKEKIIGFVCGAFDLCHAGHVLLFKDCKNYCNYLIVGLHIDPSIEDAKKNKPIQSVKERIIQLKAIKYIDEIVVYSTKEELTNILLKLKPDVRIRGDDHFSDNTKNPEVSYREVYHKRKCYSSSKLRRKIYKAEKTKVNKL